MNKRATNILEAATMIGQSIGWAHAAKYVDSFEGKFCSPASLGAAMRDESIKLARLSKIEDNPTTDEFDRLFNILMRIENQVKTLFDAIKHGDQKHQDWLKDAIDKHFATGSQPAEKK